MRIKILYSYGDWQIYYDENESDMIWVKELNYTPYGFKINKLNYWAGQHSLRFPKQIIHFMENYHKLLVML